MKLYMAVCMLAALSWSISVAANTDVTDVRDVENPARTPFVITDLVDLNSNDKDGIRGIGEVPSGKRAVIEFVSMRCGTVPPDTINIVQFFFRNTQINGFPHYFIPISKQGDMGDFPQQLWAAAQLVRIYADEGPISLLVNLSSAKPSGPAGCEVTLSGHTIDVK